MNDHAEPRPAAPELPGFLDEPTEQPTGEIGTATAPETGVDDEATTGDEAPPAAGGPEPTRSRPRRATAHPENGPRGTLLLAAGGALLAGSLVLPFLPSGGQLGWAMTRTGASPMLLFVLGAVLAGLGFVRRQVAALRDEMRRDDGDDELQRSVQEGLGFLISAQQAASERPPAAGEELQKVLLALQRQDEKVNNLTKAIKMYGKPLMEISAQGAELGAALAQIRTTVEATGETGRQSFSRLETQLRTAPGKTELAELHESLKKLTALVGSLREAGGAPVSLEPLQQQLVRIDVAVQAVAQRLEDSEVRKSLLRLEDTTQKARDDVHQLLRGENVQRATQQLQQHLDGATARLSEGLTQLRDGNLGGIEAAVRDIQREVAGVATTVAQIQVVVKQAGRAVAAPSPAPAPVPTAAPAAAAPAPAPAAPAPAATATPPATTPATAAQGEGKEAAGAYSTGTRTSSGKNLLGAIQKLKQMKN